MAENEFPIYGLALHQIYIYTNIIKSKILYVIFDALTLLFVFDAFILKNIKM